MQYLIALKGGEEMKKTKKIVLALGIVVALATPIAISLVFSGGGVMPPIGTIAFLR